MTDVLEMLGYDVDRQILQEFPVQNASAKRHGDPAWDEELKDQVLALEAPAIRRFYSGAEISRTGLPMQITELETTFRSLQPVTRKPLAPERLILKCFLSPGDIVMLTAAVRDLHQAHPGLYITDVRTSAPQLWENNPLITPLDENDPTVRTIDMHYPLIHQSNTRPYHFIHGFVQYLEEHFDVRIPVTEFKGDIDLSEEEKSWMSQVEETGFGGRFWIVMAGGKYDFTAKWWNPQFYQQVVDHFVGRIQFVQCGERDHWHLPLKNVINLVGETDIRQFVRLMHHADGVLCPVTFAMHLAAAVEAKPGRPRTEPVSWLLAAASQRTGKPIPITNSSAPLDPLTAANRAAVGSRGVSESAMETPTTTTYAYSPCRCRPS